METKDKKRSEGRHNIGQISPDVWKQAKLRAIEEGTTLNVIVEAALKLYLNPTR